MSENVFEDTDYSDFVDTEHSEWHRTMLKLAGGRRILTLDTAVRAFTLDTETREFRID